MCKLIESGGKPLWILCGGGVFQPDYRERFDTEEEWLRFWRGRIARHCVQAEEDFGAKP